MKRVRNAALSAAGIAMVVAAVLLMAAVELVADDLGARR